MPLGPRPADIPKVRIAVRVFKVSSIITGTFLLLLVAMMVFRYGFGVDIEAAGPYGPLALTPKDLIVGVNLSTILLIMHGWFYVAYVAADFVLWRMARWSFARFLLIALGGVVPITSFVFERLVPRWAEEAIARTEHPRVVAA